MWIVDLAQENILQGVGAMERSKLLLTQHKRAAAPHISGEEKYEKVISMFWQMAVVYPAH